MPRTEKSQISFADWELLQQGISLDRVRDTEGAIMPGGPPNSRRIPGCDDSNGRR